MLAHCIRQWRSSKTALARRLVFAESPATRYTDTMVVQCWSSVIDDSTTFNQHWIMLTGNLRQNCQLSLFYVYMSQIYNLIINLTLSYMISMPTHIPGEQLVL